MRNVVIKLDLATRIRTLREEANLTQLQFAHILNISNSALSQYESGGRVPSDDVKAKIADYFGVSLDYLYGRTNAKSASSTTESDLKAAFWGGDKDLTPEDMDAMWADVENFAAFVAEKKKREKHAND